MTTSTTRPAPPGSALPPADDRTRNRRLGAVIVLGVLVLSLAAVIGWGRVHSQPQRATTASSVPARAATTPGGSVYDEQVPAAARVADPFGPGSPDITTWSVYTEQVPAAARVAKP
jgi:hypothetical protein